MKTFKEYLTELTDHQKKFIDGFINLSDDDMKKFKKWINSYKQAFKKLIEYFKTHKIDKTGITSYKDLQKYLDIAEIEATKKPESKLNHIKDEYEQFEIIEDIKGNRYYTFIPYSLRASCEIASSKIGDVLGRWCVAECKSEDGLETWIEYTLGEYEGVMMFIKPILRRTKEAYIRGDHKELGKILHDKNDHRIGNVNSVFDSETINYIDSILKQNKKKIKENYIKFILKDIDKLSLNSIYQVSLNITDKNVLRKLQDVIIEKDKEGEWCYQFAKDVEGTDIKKLEDAIIKKDEDGYWCYEFVMFIEGADIQRLQDAIIEKDKKGNLCYNFALNIKGADIQKLQDAIIKKDKTGYWCYKFAKDVKGADIKKLEDAVIEKDKDGNYCYEFAKNIKGADVKKLQDAVIKKDKYGIYCYDFAKDVKGVDIQKLEDAIIEKDKDGWHCYWFAKNIKEANINNILQKMKKKFKKNNEHYKKILKLSLKK